MSRHRHHPWPRHEEDIDARKLAVMARGFTPADFIRSTSSPCTSPSSPSPAPDPSAALAESWLRLHRERPDRWG